MPTFEIVAAEPAPETQAAPPPSYSEPRPKARRFHALTLKDHARLLLPFLVMGAAGAVARFEYPYWWPTPDLVAFVANAFIVTAVLGVLLELFSARLLLERVSEDLAQRLIGRGLPMELQASIRDIVATGLARDRFVKSYAFSPPQDGLVHVDIEVRYELRNYSEAVRDYAPEIAVESFARPDFRFLEYGIAGRKIHTFSDESLAAKVESMDELHLKRVPRSALPPVTLKPVRTGEKAACQVTWRYHVVVPEQYCDVIDFGEAAQGATLHLQTIPEELDFVSGGDPSLHHDPGSQSWYFDKSFTPGQYLRAWWFPKSAARAARYR